MEPHEPNMANNSYMHDTMTNQSFPRQKNNMNNANVTQSQTMIPPNGRAVPRLLGNNDRIHRPYSESSPQPYVPTESNVKSPASRTPSNIVEAVLNSPPLFSKMKTTSVLDIEEEKVSLPSPTNAESDDEKADALIITQDSITDAGPQETHAYLQNLEKFNEHIQEREQQLFGADDNDLMDADANIPKKDEQDISEEKGQLDSNEKSPALSLQDDND
ncbi:hypothetical protein RFI_09622, partial [Reticulomyxa filosa]